jgi:Haem-binding uptake, Tiki superfamily, ChaN
MRKMVLFLIHFLLLNGLVFSQTTRVAPLAVERKLASYLNSHGKSPEAYVLSKFAKYDLVLIGEPHWVRQHVTLVSGLIPRLHKRGVNTLAIEFARRIDQPLIDALLNAPVYDEKLARQITMQSEVQWGYQEYIDLYKAAWQVNRKLPAGASRFRILGLEGSPDWSVIKRRDDLDNVQVRRAVWHGETEKDWADLLIDSVLTKNQKALVYCGTHHAFTKYAQPIVTDGKLVRKEDSRFGQYLYANAPTRIFMIALHFPWPGGAGYGSPPVLPADGVLDRTLEAAGTKWKRVGFDLNDTPFGALVSETAVYKHGYEPFTLDEFADGYIYVGPIWQYEPVTPIADFIDESNIEYARANSANPADRTKSVADFNRDIASSLEGAKKRWREVAKR